MDFPGDEELLRFFHCSRTEMSCMENPHTFIRQLRDYDLIPEHFYKKMNRTKSKEVLKKGLYEFLDWFEREQSQHIKVFWRCVFKETIVNQYPILQELRNSIRDGSFHLETQMFNCKPQEETTVRKRKEPTEDEIVERRQESPVPNKRKEKKNHLCSDEKQPSQSSPSPNKSPFNSKRQEETDVRKRKEPSEVEIVESPVLKKKKEKRNHLCNEEEGPSQSCSSPRKNKIVFSTPVKGDTNDIWTWPFYKSNLPVTCGTLKGTLKRDEFRKGQPCILVNKQWLTPPEFESRGGKSSNKNWKISIRCMETPLAKLLEMGHLQSATFRKRSKKATKFFLTNDESTNTDSNHEVKSEVQPQEMPSSSNDTNTDKLVFNVTCGALSGKLYRKRFARGTRGHSIRTDVCWMTPEDFAKDALGSKDACWKKDIMWEGQSLGVVIYENLLRIHSLLCACRLCKPSDGDLDEQQNDDECFVCKGEGDLVICDECPRSFHPKCHLPPVDDNILSDNQTWMCTFCLFSTAKGWCYSDHLEGDVILSKQISNHMLACQYLLLLLFSADDEQFFATNPCGYLDDYSAVVKTPMWLCKIAEKIKNNDYCYVSEFVSDVHLIFSNCALYNKDNPNFLSMGSRLKKLFDEEFKNAF
ncbi:nuclear body protein SP140-like [Festucalex cinctus]